MLGSWVAKARRYVAAHRALDEMNRRPCSERPHKTDQIFRKTNRADQRLTGLASYSASADPERRAHSGRSAVTCQVPVK